MKDRLRDGLTYSNVVSTLALFAAVGGISYAAVALPRNSVGTPQVKPNAITAAKLGFSLGLAHGSKASTILQSAACPTAASCPAPFPHTLTSTRVRLKPAHKLLLLGSATFSRAGDSGTEPTFVQLGTVVADTGQSGASGRLAGSETSTLSFREVMTVPVQRRRGERHRVELTASAVTEGASGKTVAVENAQLIAIALPPAE